MKKICEPTLIWYLYQNSKNVLIEIHWCNFYTKRGFNNLGNTVSFQHGRDRVKIFHTLPLDGNGKWTSCFINCTTHLVRDKKVWNSNFQDYNIVIKSIFCWPLSHCFNTVYFIQTSFRRFILLLFLGYWSSFYYFF